MTAINTPGSASGGSASNDELQAVRAFWDTQSCGEVYARTATLPLPDQLEAQAIARFSLEPYLEPFARFSEGRGQEVLEIGVGMGADHLRWAQQDPKRLIGVDLTPRAIAFTASRFREHGLQSELLIANAELLPFPDNSFDIVYSWGVLHHTPRTEKAIGEVHRVLRPGGQARIMIYHRPSVVGILLWARYALLGGHPRRNLTEIYAQYMESPGTKGYTIAEAEQMMAPFRQVRARVQLSFGDLLLGAVGQRHQGTLLTVARRLWPRWAVRRYLSQLGLAMLIDGVK